MKRKTITVEGRTFALELTEGKAEARDVELAIFYGRGDEAQMIARIREQGDELGGATGHNVLVVDTYPPFFMPADGGIRYPSETGVGDVVHGLCRDAEVDGHYRLQKWFSRQP